MNYVESGYVKCCVADVEVVKVSSIEETSALGNSTIFIESIPNNTIVQMS